MKRATATERAIVLADIPSQDNEGFRPDAMGFHTGWKYAEKFHEERTAELVFALESMIIAFKQTSNLTTTQQYQFLEPIERTLNAYQKGDKSLLSRKKDNT